MARVYYKTKQPDVLLVQPVEPLEGSCPVELTETRSPDSIITYADVLEIAETTAKANRCFITTVNLTLEGLGGFGIGIKTDTPQPNTNLFIEAGITNKELTDKFKTMLEKSTNHKQEARGKYMQAYYKLRDEYLGDVKNNMQVNNPT